MDINIKIQNLEDKIDKLEDKIDNILKLLQDDIKPNCNKMNYHIDFIESIYDNVKNPLGFLCNKINYLRTDNNSYNLENK
tara:strand:+ start:750 stop:989 length:240 start_codon:yes stop_codon:yes gene_type:complete